MTSMKISLWTKTQNTVKSVLGTLLLILTAFGTAQASHLAAADISVKYIGNQPGACVPIFTYEITLDVFKACEQGSVDLGRNESISIYSPSGCYTGTINVPVAIGQNGSRIDTLDQLCNDAKNLNSCRFPTQSGPNAQPGFIRHRYIATVSLPQACGDWTFYWYQSARNAGITNLVNPGNEALYVSCMINNVALPRGSSPKFSVTPTPFLCVGKLSTFLNGPDAQDRDTRIEVLPAVPKGYGTGPTPISYTAPYTFTNPVNSPTGYVVNSQTGTTTFTAPTQGKFVLTFRLNKYLGNTLVGYTERDVQVAVLPCVGDVPTISQKPLAVTGGTLVQSGDSGNVVTVCPGSTLRFNLAGKTPSTKAMLGMDDTLGSRIGRLTSIGLPNPSGAINNVLGSFEYTPKRGEEGEYTKIFTVSDTSCSRSGQVIVQKSYVSVLIKVPGGIDAGPDGYYCPTGGPGYQIEVYTPDLNTRYSWDALPGGAGIKSLSCTNCPNPVATPDSNTTYVVTVAPTPYICKLRDTITVEVNRIRTIPGDEVVFCRPGLLQLDAVVTGRKVRQKMRCDSGAFSACKTPNTAGSAQVGFCTDATGGAVLQTPFRTASASARTQMILQKEELRNAKMQTGTIRSISFFVTGTPSTAPLENFKVSMRCTQRNSYNNSTTFETGLVQVVNTPSLPPLTAGWNTINFDRPYNWDTSQNLVVEVCFNSNAFQPGSANTEVQYSATSGKTVLQGASNSSDVCRTGGSPTASVNRPNIRLDYCMPEDTPFHVYWRPGLYLRDSDVVNPVAYVPTSYQVYAEVKGYEDCISRDTLNIILAQDTLYTTPIDSFICAGDIAILKASPADYYKWYQGNFLPATTLDCDTCPRVLANPKQNTDYFLVGYNYWGKDSTVCADTVKATVRIKNVNPVRLTPKESTIKYGDAVALYANGANVYHWSPGTSLNTTVGATVMASPKTTTTYVVTGINLDGCQTSDTGTVIVDPRTLVIVPNAFTPNGDHVNDYFMPRNLTTQRIVEFRVFNRWGQQMFHTTGDTHGWDGTWNGEPQDAGTYSYIIRTTSPDGKAETFKGDVVLIR